MGDDGTEYDFDQGDRGDEGDEEDEEEQVGVDGEFFFLIIERLGKIASNRLVLDFLKWRFLFLKLLGDFGEEV